MADSESQSKGLLPVTELPARALDTKSGVHPSLYVANWILFSNATILFNKYLVDTAGFRYPIILTCWHLVSATIATQCLARMTTALDSRHSIRMNTRLYVRTILPIGVLYTGSLVCSNLVYLYLSLAFTQMLKSAAPVAALITSWAWGVADPSLSKFLNVLIIAIGVAITSFGEINFSIIGFLFQVGGIVFEAMRIVMIEVVLSGKGRKMDPLVSLYYYAPSCAFFNLLIALFTEARHFRLDDVRNTGFTLLLLNALVAFMLNVSSLFLIGKTSGVVLTLTGIFKSILLVAVSAVIWQTRITLLQATGYSIALAGLAYYSLGHDQVVNKYRTSSAWVAYTLSSGSYAHDSPHGRKHLSARRQLMIISFRVVLAVFTVALIWRMSGGRLVAHNEARPAVVVVERN